MSGSARSRRDRVGAAVANMLAILPAAADGELGYPTEHKLVEQLAMIFAARLGPLEVPALLVALCQAFQLQDASAAEEALESVLFDMRAGQPVPTFMDVHSEARGWAAWASPAERSAYLAAIWNRIPPAKRKAFLRAIQTEQRAA